MQFTFLQGLVRSLVTMIYLTKNAIKMITDGNLDLQPHLQVLDISVFGHGPEPTNRYIVQLSDGVHKQKATLPKQYNHYIDSEELQKGFVLKLIKYSCPIICSSR